MLKRSGISLPINILVILAVAVIVLLAVVAFFTGVFPSGGRQLSKQQKIRACCQEYVRQGGCKDTTVTVSDVSDDVKNVNDCGIVKKPGVTCCMGVS